MTEVALSLFRGEVIKPSGVSMKTITETVAARYRIKVSDLKGPARYRHVARPRQEAMWLMRQVRWADGTPRYSFPMIGAFLGGRDHTTIIHGVRAHEARLVAQRVAA